MSGISKKKIFVVGAGRSGTNLIVNALSSCENIHSLGELRHVWSYAQKDKNSDYIDGLSVGLSDRRWIYDYFAERCLEYPSKDIFIDKTTANALRIPFVRSLFDDALFIHVVRDVRDNLLSRIIQYNGGKCTFSSVGDTGLLAQRFSAVRNGYVEFKKRVADKSIPLSRVPSALTYSAFPRILHLFGFSMPVWGERTAGFHDYYKKLGRDVALVCQWRDIVNQARFDGLSLPRNQYLEVRFEDLLSNPVLEVARIFDVCPEIDPDRVIGYLKSNVISTNKGKWSTSLDEAALNRLGPFVRTTLEAFGYDW